MVIHREYPFLLFLFSRTRNAITRIPKASSDAMLFLDGYSPLRAFTYVEPLSKAAWGCLRINARIKKTNTAWAVQISSITRAKENRS
jgi:hypothetical protein